jgi:2-iminobutanoate/2-iminopropanoate deaminase
MFESWPHQAGAAEPFVFEHPFATPKQFVASENAPTTGFTDLQKPPPIAQAIRYGNMLFVSGQGPLDPATRTVVEGEIEVQTRRTLDNLLSVLDPGGATLANVVNVRVVLRHVEDFPRFVFLRWNIKSEVGFRARA